MINSNSGNRDDFDGLEVEISFLITAEQYATAVTRLAADARRAADEQAALYRAKPLVDISKFDPHADVGLGDCMPDDIFKLAEITTRFFTAQRYGRLAKRRLLEVRRPVD